MLAWLKVPLVTEEVLYRSLNVTVELLQGENNNLNFVKVLFLIKCLVGASLLVSVLVSESSLEIILQFSAHQGLSTSNGLTPQIESSL